MKRTKIYAIILIALFIIGMASKVNAESVTFKATANTGELKEGEEVVITLNLSNINVNEDGIYTFGGKLVYDKNVFEEIKEEDFEGQNNWSIAYNSENTEKEGTFLATKNTGLKTNQAIGKLTLKTKTNIKSTRTEIKFTEVSSVGQDTIELANEVITLSITGTKKDDNTGAQTGNTVDGNTTGDNSTKNEIDNSGNGSGNNGAGNNGSGNGNGGSTITIKNQTNPNSSNRDNTTSKDKIPQTGVENVAIIIAGIVILTTMIVAYIKYKKNLDIK